MNVRHLLLPLAAVLALTTAQAQVKVGANPGSLAPGAVLDVEGSSGARTVISNDGRMGVNTSAPNTSADLELGSANKALFLNRVPNTAAITSPQPGMVIYDLSVGCVKTYQGNPAAWSDCLGQGGGSITGLSCGSAVFSPASATQTIAYSGTLTVPYVGGNGGTYSAQTFTQNGLTFSLPAGNFTNGNGSLVYAITGTPQSPGTMTVSVAAGGYYCSGSTALTLPVNSNPGGIASLDCAKPAHAGVLTTGTTYPSSSTLSTTINYTGGNGVAYAAQAVNSTGVSGLIANLPAGNFATGNGSVTYTITGTASGTGTASFAITLGGLSCSFTRTVTDKSATPAQTSGSGTLSGKTCFDVVMQNDGGSCGTLTSRISQKADFTQTATNTQSYTFTPSAAVSNVRFVYVNTNGQVIQSITPGGSYTGTNLSGPMTVTVVYYPNLNATATGLSQDQALTADLYVVYNSSATNANPTANERQLKLTARIQDCSCCGVFMGPNGTSWRSFMCHNLGADMSLDPFTPAAGVHGAKYKWGARTDETGMYMSQADDQNPAYDYSSWGSAGEKPIGSWSAGFKNGNDPCPAGYKIPAAEDYRTLIAYNKDRREYVGSWSATTANYTSAVYYRAPSPSTERLLMFPAVGQRLNGGNIIGRGGIADYWTADNGLRFSNASPNSALPHVSGSVNDNGFPVRCIAY